MQFLENSVRFREMKPERICTVNCDGNPKGHEGEHGLAVAADVSGGGRGVEETVGSCS